MVEKKTGSIIGSWCLMTALGIYFLIVSLTYSSVHTGTLYATGREYQRSSKGSGAYYVKQYFYKDENRNDTCVVIRPRQYSTVKEVNRAKDDVKLYTTRTIWTYRYDKSKCYDHSIKRQNFILGIVLLGISNGLPLLIILCLICYSCYKSFNCDCNFSLSSIFYNNRSVEVHRGQFRSKLPVPIEDPEYGGKKSQKDTNLQLKDIYHDRRENNGIVEVNQIKIL